MQKEQDALLALIMRDIPFRFIKDFNEKLPLLYSQAHADVTKNPLLMEEEAKFELPYHRRAICETAFRKTALDVGLKARDLKHTAGNCNYVLVQCKQIVITQVAVREGEGIRPALSRDQHSAVNQFLDSPGFSFIDAPSLKDPKPVYATIVHGPNSEKSSENAFAYLIFPPAPDASEDTPEYKYSLALLIQEYKNRKLDVQEQKAPEERKQPRVKGKASGQ